MLDSEHSNKCIGFKTMYVFSLNVHSRTSICTSILHSTYHHNSAKKLRSSGN